MDLFLEGIKDKGYIIKGEPQRYKSKISYLKSFLASVDIDFRKSLDNQNNYHVMQGNIYINIYLLRKNFLYKNIHITNIR